VNDYLFSGEYDMKVALSADNPGAVLEYIEANPGQSGLYFLDVDLQCEINGIELAVKIREKDVSATIVFITAHSDMMRYTFSRRVEAMEYILKINSPDEIEQKIVECMQVAYKRFLGGKHSTTKYYSASIGHSVINVPYDEILYFESSVDNRNSLLLHTANSALKFRGYLTDVAKLGPPFYWCHKSYIVNINNIKSIDKAKRIITMKNDEELVTSRRRVPEILELISSE